MFASRSHENFTSFDSTAEPSSNFAAGSSLNVNTVLSALRLPLTWPAEAAILLGSAGSTVISVS